LDFFSDPTYIAQEEHEKIYSRCKPEVNDVLYIEDGATTGLAAINKYDFSFSMLSSLALLKPNRAVINHQFLKYWLNCESVKRQLLGNMAGAAIKRFTIAKIKSFEIANPPIELQNQLAEIIQNIESQKAKAEASLQKSGSLFNALLQRAFKGELFAGDSEAATEAPTRSVAAEAVQLNLF
jgi:type I restriction enzyme S subunit